MKMNVVHSKIGWPCLECGKWIEGSAIRGDMGHYHHACAPICVWCGEELEHFKVFMGSKIHPDCETPAREEIEREMYPEDPAQLWMEP